MLSDALTSNVYTWLDIDSQWTRLYKTKKYRPIHIPWMGKQKSSGIQVYLNRMGKISHELHGERIGFEKYFSDSFLMSHNWKERVDEIKEERCTMMLSFCMGFHTRLGEGSAVYRMPYEISSIIVENVVV